MTAAEILPVSTLPADIAQEVALIQEQYPRISEKINQLWGSPELRVFLDSILFDERGDRHGFPATVASALLRIHKKQIN
jgi:hypothetical protein